MLHLIPFIALSGSPAKATPAELAYGRFKSMVGEWSGADQNGTKIRHRYTLVAQGSAVMEESWFDAHKGEMMITMYHLDRGKLMLTHYCMAKNQPRLVAKSISADGGKIAFHFLDGTNLKSRNQGHMDRVNCEFPDANHFSTRWTWFSKGKEQWMELFKFERIRTPKEEDAATEPLGNCCGPKE